MTGRHRGAERQPAEPPRPGAPLPERAALSLSLVALGCSPSAQTRHCGTGAGGARRWHFSAPSEAPAHSRSALMGKSPPRPPWGCCPCGQNRGRLHLCSLWEAASTQPDTARLIQHARLPSSCVPCSCSPVPRKSPCVFVFVFFHCTAARWGKGIP